MQVFYIKTIFLCRNFNKDRRKKTWKWNKKGKNVAEGLMMIHSVTLIQLLEAFTGMPGFLWWSRNEMPPPSPLVFGVGIIVSPFVLYCMHKSQQRQKLVEYRIKRINKIRKAYAATGNISRKWSVIYVNGSILLFIISMFSNIVIDIISK
jgi:hypothetical protein